jgi:hypothetical protein
VLQANELQPWLIVRQAAQAERAGTFETAAQETADSAAGSTGSIVLWQMTAGAAGDATTALALFSSEERARDYATAHVSAAWQLIQPPRTPLLQLLINSYRAGIVHAVLDPDGESARTVFQLQDVLRAARYTLAHPQ